MSLYSLISSILSYVFTTIIYLFIFSIIVLIYRDIKKESKNSDEYIEDGLEEEEFSEDDAENDLDEDEEDNNYTAILKTVITKESRQFSLRRRYRIGVGPIVVGRGDMCDITIPDVYLSQEHFEIYCVKGEWYINDLKSKNGTYLNDIPVKKPIVLDDDDVIAFGNIQFIFNRE